METLAAPMARKPLSDAVAPTPLGERLRAARTAARLSMRELAEAASAASPGLAAATIGHTPISLIEAGRQTALDAETAVRLARPLGVTVEWLITGEPPHR